MENRVIQAKTSLVCYDQVRLEGAYLQKGKSQKNNVKLELDENPG